MPTATADDVIQGVVAKWVASSASLTGIIGLYQGVKPPSVDYPYVMLVSLDNDRLHRSCANIYTEHLLRFVARGRTPEIAAATIRSVIGVYDGASLTIPNGTQVHLERGAEGFYSEDEKVYVATVDYRIVRGYAR